MQPPEGVPHRLPEHWWSPEGNKVSLYIFKAQKMDVKPFNIDPKRNVMCSLNRFSWRKKTGTFHQYFSSRPSDITVKISHPPRQNNPQSTHRCPIHHRCPIYLLFLHIQTSA